MKKKIEVKSVRCVHCNSKNNSYRRKTNDFFCRNCGKTFTLKEVDEKEGEFDG